MKYFILILLLGLSVVSFAQSSFSSGFNVGFRNGYCYNDYGCTSPIPPNSPIPTSNESNDSYQDGYNRGFQVGLDAKRSTGSGGNINNGYRQVVPPAQWKAPISNDLLIKGALYESEMRQRAADNTTIYLNRIDALIRKLYACNPDVASAANVQYQKAVDKVNTYTMQDIYDNYNSLEQYFLEFERVINNNLANCN